MEDEFSSEQRLAGHEEESLNSEGFHFHLLKSNGNVCVHVICVSIYMYCMHVMCVNMVYVYVGICMHVWYEYM